MHIFLRFAQRLCIILCMDGVPTWTLGDRLRKAREDADLSIQQMADKLGYHRNSITAYESGDRSPKPGLVRAWADICNVSLEWLEYGTIELHEQAKLTSNWQQVLESNEPRLFDPDGPPHVIDLRDHIVAQVDEKEPFALYAVPA